MNGARMAGNSLMVEIEDLERDYASIRDKVADLRSYL